MKLKILLLLIFFSTKLYSQTTLRDITDVISFMENKTFYSSEKNLDIKFGFINSYGTYGITLKSYVSGREMKFINIQVDGRGGFADVSGINPNDGNNFTIRIYNSNKVIVGDAYNSTVYSLKSQYNERPIKKEVVGNKTTPQKITTPKVEKVQTQKSSVTKKTTPKQSNGITHIYTTVDNSKSKLKQKYVNVILEDTNLFENNLESNTETDFFMSLRKKGVIGTFITTIEGHSTMGYVYHGTEFLTPENEKLLDKFFENIEYRKYDKSEGDNSIRKGSLFYVNKDLSNDSPKQIIKGGLDHFMKIDNSTNTKSNYVLRDELPPYNLEKLDKAFTKYGYRRLSKSEYDKDYGSEIVYTLID